MIIDYTKTFTKQFKKQPRKIQNSFKARLALFTEDPSNTILNHHALKGSMQGFFSINVTGDVRALYYKKGDGTIVIFAFIGSHSQLYR